MRKKVSATLNKARVIRSSGVLIQIVIMKIILKYRKYENPKTYFAFNLIDLTYINTCQVWSINFTICNVLLKILKEKHNYENDL